MTGTPVPVESGPLAGQTPLAGDGPGAAHVLAIPTYSRSEEFSLLLLGRNETPFTAQEVHHFIRNVLGRLVGTGVAENIRILYGGSVKPDNAKQLIKDLTLDYNKMRQANITKELLEITTAQMALG